MNAAVQVKADAGTTELERAPVPLAVVETQAAPSPAPKKKRRGGRFFLMALLPALLVVGGGYFWITGGRYQDTDNANLRQARVSITSEATGRIVESNVGENIRVKAGDVLFVVDPEPYRIALAQADAALAAARIDVEQLRAAYSQAIAQERVAAGALDSSTSQYERSKEPAGRGISAKSALD